MNTCEQTVAGVTLVGQSQNYELMPEPNYARKISAAIATLDGLRVALTRELRAHATAATVQDLARRLAAAYARTATSLSALEPSFAAEPTQAALSAAIQQARDAYTALATAAAEESISGYEAARKRITQAESDVDWILENYELLGYTAKPGLDGRQIVGSGAPERAVPAPAEGPGAVPQIPGNIGFLSPYSW